MSYTKYLKLLFKVYDQAKSLSLFAVDMGGGRIMKKVTNSDIGETRV